MHYSVYMMPSPSHQWQWGGQKAGPKLIHQPAPTVTLQHMYDAHCLSNAVQTMLTIIVFHSISHILRMATCFTELFSSYHLSQRRIMYYRKTHSNVNMRSGMHVGRLYRHLKL